MELICAECKNKWMPSNRINEVICPYCGNIIGELSRDFSSFEDGIAYIRNMFGDDIFEQRRFFFICTEYCLDYYEKEISAFKILYDSGLSKRILNLRGSDEKIIVRSKKQFVYQLRMKNGMNTSWAEYVIDLFCFATGISTEKEFSSNILSKVRKAENGDPEAQYQVGICYKDGKGVERSLDDAIKWLSLSAGQKYTEAMVALYHIYAKENNKNIAKKYLEEAVNYGNVNAINTLAYCLYHGDDGYKQNIEKAVALLDSGVSQKSIISMRRRADIYLKDGDVERATELLKDAGNMGDIDSMVKYAWIGFRDVKDFGKGVELKNLLEKGAANGNIEAVYYLLAALIISIIKTGENDKEYRNDNFYNDSLKSSLDSSSVDDFIAALERFDELRSVLSYIEGEGEQSQGVLSEMYSVIRDILIGVFAERGGFSIRNFVRAKGGKVLFIEYDLAIGSVLTPIYRLFFDLAIKEALGRTSSQGNVYLFCDEFKLLPNLQHIDDGVNFGRSLGLKVFAGLQSIEQLFETYGEIKGRNLAAGFSSIFAFKANDVSTRDYIRSLYGSNIILEQYQGMNKTLIEDKREGNTVEDWDLNSLKVGEAVVGLPFEKPFKFYFDNFG